MEAVGRLAGGVAHDFNNLLTAIKGNAQLLLLSLPPDDPSRPELEQIDRTVDRAAALTRQLLTVSRRQKVQPRLMSPNETAEDMGHLLRRVLGEGVRLVVTLAPDAGVVNADPAQVEQVLLNLAVNARDAMPDGGTLIIETANTELDDEYASRHAEVVAGPYVMLAVSDTGTGMTRETQARIFEPFFTTKERGKGTGLGLPTVYGIVRQAGGHVWVYSEPGRGTTFKVYLPRVEGAVSAPRAPEEASAEGGGGATVLLVEDDDVVRTLTRRTLERIGYAVVEARGGAEAIALCGEGRAAPDVVLTDVVMPGMGGRELVGRLREGNPSLRALFMSGYTEETVAALGDVGPADGFLQKPFSPDRLRAKLREVLGAA
jgi:CheY-like chemotaxis protein